MPLSFLSFLINHIKVIIPWVIPLGMTEENTPKLFLSNKAMITLAKTVKFEGIWNLIKKIKRVKGMLNVKTIY